MQDRYRHDETRVPHDVIQETEDAGKVAAFGNVLGLLLNEESQAIGQLRLLVIFQGLGRHEQG